MSSKEEAKREVQRLVELYDKYKTSGEIKNFTGREENTKTTFILPLFKALGWDVHNEKAIEVLTEERVLRGAVDYAFQLQGSYKFFVEAKPIGTILKEHAKQALEYGVNSGNAWVVLTNFESIIVFNCEWREKEWWKNTLFEQLDYKDYIAKFDLLWLLSKESAISNGLEDYAGTVTKRVPRLPVDKELLQNLLQYRLKISKEISKSGTYSEEEIDELVQKLLSRLLFIRNCEDRGFEAKFRLNSALEFFKKSGKGLPKMLAATFKHYDEIYNSGLFEEREIDKIKFDEKLLAEVIESLYFMSDGTRYNFNVIPADIMGNLYEQYLGHILKKTPERTKLKEGKTHRKEQGIYYTPAYIVDYIVKNTVGELLKDKKVKADKIRILDPACGSGSFLIKAFQAMDEYYKGKDKKYDQTKLDSSGTYSKKVEILKNSIFGVDLDQKAVELAQLNLLLQIAEKGEKLPLLEKNIQCGDSLIDDETVNKKAFKWEERFKGVMAEGGFDIIVGNPPWGADIDNIIDYLKNKFPNSTQDHKDSYKCFIEQGLHLLNEGGILSFIVPNTLLLQSRYKDIRLFLKQYTLLKIINLGEKVFEGVEAPSCIFIVMKQKAKDHNKIRVLDLSYSKDNAYKAKMLSQPDYLELEQDIYNKTVDNNFVTFYRALKSDEKPLDEVMECKDCGIKYQRVAVGMKEKGKNDLFERLFYGDEQKSELDKKYIIGADLKRYFIDKNKKRFMKHNYKSILKNNEIVYFNETYFNMPEKILWRQTADRPICSISGSCWFANTLQVGVIREDYIDKLSIKYLLALLNSKYFAYLYIQNVKEMGRVFPQVKLNKVKSLPIKQISESKQQPIIKLVDKMLSLNKCLYEIGNKMTNERARIEEEIKKTDAEIDEFVYKIYGITDSEKKIIEESLKK